MPSITLKNGNLYIDSDVYETYLNSADSVVLIHKESKYYLMPVQQMAGGLLMKIMNAKGDRVINAVEFLQYNNIETNDTRAIEAKWDQEFSALSLEL
tara:strand:+ start:794 stop:1084 length:291 start_codon:yes stop_codon:yes gene_type:complete